mgnify:CR=1 FL=1
MTPLFLAARTTDGHGFRRGKSRIKIEPTISYHYVGKLSSIDEEGNMAIREILLDALLAEALAPEAMQEEAA